MYESYFKQYGIDLSIPMKSIIEDFDDSEKINTILLILDNLESWWSLCFEDKQEEIEYNKLVEIINKVKELIELRKQV